MGKLCTAGVWQSRAPRAVSCPKAGTELSSLAVLWLTSDASPEVFVRQERPCTPLGGRQTMTGRRCGG